MIMKNYKINFGLWAKLKVKLLFFSFLQETKSSDTKQIM
jgi:hypothetical protein